MVDSAKVLMVVWIGGREGVKACLVDDVGKAPSHHRVGVPAAERMWFVDADFESKVDPQAQVLLLQQCRRQHQLQEISERHDTSLAPSTSL